MTLHNAEHILDFAKAWEMSPLRREGVGASRWLSEPRLLDYQSVCLLGKQIERLFTIVPRERVLVLVLDDVKEDPRREYLRVLEFLGLPDDGRMVFPVRNPAKRVRWRGFQRILALAMKGERVIRGKVGLPPTNSWLLRELNTMNKTPRPRPSLAPDLRAQLEAYFAPDIQQLEQLLNRDFSGWLAMRAEKTSR